VQNSPVTATGELNPNPVQGQAMWAKTSAEGDTIQGTGGLEPNPNNPQVTATVQPNRYNQQLPQNTQQQPTGVQNPQISGAPPPNINTGGPQQPAWTPPSSGSVVLPGMNPTFADPFQAQGGGVWTGQGWVPRSHPQAQPFLNGQTGQNGTGGTNSQPTDQYMNNPFMQWLMQNGSGYTPGNFNSGFELPTYDPTNLNVNIPNDPNSYQYNGGINQFNAPNQAGMQGQLNSLMGYLFQNPTSMTDTGVAQLKEAQKETALSTQNQQRQMLDERNAARGMVGSGYEQAQLADQAATANDSMLRGYRDIDIQKMQQDFEDRGRVAELGNSMLTGEMDRATSAYDRTLAGQREIENARQEQARSGIDRYNAQLSGQRLGLDAGRFNADEQYRAFESAAARQEQALRAAIATDASGQAGGQQRLAQNQLIANTYNSLLDDDTKRTLGQAGIDVDRLRIMSQEQIARMDDTTRRAIARAQNALGFAELSSRNNQFNQTMSFNREGRDINLWQWLIGEM
jgi:hypothetical protein